jgi:adenosylcobinamide kinase/adenosylcobinamide-phosphate guanylyltransferase
MSKITLFTGGGRSGKSSHALKSAEKYDKDRLFIATAVGFDDEMRERIKNHQMERGNEFITIEEAKDIASVIKKYEQKVNVILIDCLSVWLGNLMYYYPEKSEFEEINSFLNALKNTKSDIIIVTNEVGMGIIPGDKISRKYRDLAGSLNQKVAKIANSVILMVSGIEVKIK